MQQNPTLRARIDDGGRVVWHGYEGKRWETIKRFLVNQEVEISIGRRKKRRSRSQNAYYWSVIVPAIMRAAGYSGSPDEAEIVHDGLRAKFLAQPTDGPLQVIRSTTSLTTQEFSDYILRCQHFAAEFYGVYVPDPNEASLCENETT